MTASIVTTAYNWKEALELVLLSASRQTVLPVEVVVADDGSRPDTRELIDRMRPTLPFPVKHVWQEDKGFRLALAADRAFAQCTGDIVIKIDGDIIMERHFVEDHIRHSQRGFYIGGSRSKLTDELSQRLFAAHDFKLSWLTKGVTRKLNAMRIPWLTPHLYNYHTQKRIKGCNMSFFRDDLYAVNGFDGDMVGYGSEDTDLAHRIERLGRKRRTVKFSCIEYHLYHDETGSKFNTELRRHNINLRDQHDAQGVVKIKNGIDQFL